MERPLGWPFWAWLLAILLHVLVIFIAMHLRGKPLPDEQEAPSGISVQLDNNSGQQQTAAPPSPNRGPPQMAQSPTAPPPPPPPPPQPQQPEVNLNVPPDLLANLPPPPPRPQAQPHPRQRPVAKRPPALPGNGMMMMSGMSYGSSPSNMAAAPSPHRALNLDLPQTDAQAVAGPQLTVKGDIGADWMSELNDWVNAHKYYPQAAAEQGQQGAVTIEFTVDRQGNVSGLKMLTSSGYQFLDLAWLGMFQGVQLPAFPRGTKSDHITVDATMNYELVAPGSVVP